MAKLDKKKMACNKPCRISDGSKKFVVKGCQGGTEKIIPARSKSFGARHKCSTAKSKVTARYCSCKN